MKAKPSANGGVTHSITESSSRRVYSIPVALFSAFIFGSMLAVSQALRVHKGEFRFEFSIWTAIAFLVGFNCLLAYLRVVLGHGEKTPRSFRYGGLVVLVLIALTVLLYPWWSHKAGKLVEEFAGAGVALCFVVAGLSMVYRTVLAANREEESQEVEEMRSAKVRSQNRNLPKGCGL